MKHVKTLAILLALASAPAAFAAAPMGGMDGMDMKPSAPPQKAARPVAAEIKKIDQEAGKVTLKHGPIENLGMPAMTMAFPVKDHASLNKFKEGESVSVTFDNVGGEPTVVDMRRKQK